MFVQPSNTGALLDVGSAPTPTDGNASTPAAMQDRFLKLLVAQLNHQDPMNPLDNAQMTTQMAQINTVTGLQTLNLTLQGIAEQISAMQALQGTAMIGRSVLCEGDQLRLEGDAAQGSFELEAAAANVKVEIVSPGGAVVDSVELGAQGKGRGSFSWDASQYKAGSAASDVSALRFRIVASGSEGSVAATPLMHAKVLATGNDAGALTLTLENGETMRYADIRGML